MNKWQKEVLGNRIASEEQILNEIKNSYLQALKDIDDKVAALKGRLETEEGEINKSSIEYQLGFQKALQTQIKAILEQLNTQQFETISEYLKQSYEDGFIGTMYDLQGQGIPIVAPIDEQQIIRSLKNNSKLSKGLWGDLAEDNSVLQTQIRAEISRGISQGYSYSKIASLLAGRMNVAYNKTKRIIRTEAHRITQEATLDAQYKAKEAGADVVKQWDASLDRRTRTQHAVLDGQIVEVDQPFKYGSHKAMHPGGFGVPSLDINCRCTILQRAKWALDEEELEVLKQRAEYFGLNKRKSLNEFKEKFYQMENWLKDQDKYSEEYKITPDERSSLMRYVQSDSYKINDALRRNTKLTSLYGLYKEDVENIKSALNKLPSYKGLLTRSVEFYSKEDLEEFINQHQVGKTIKYNQFISTTAGKTYNPDGQIQIMILNAKNGKDITPFNYKEKEVLYDLDQEFEVVEVEEKNGKYQIKLREKNRTKK